MASLTDRRPAAGPTTELRHLARGGSKTMFASGLGVVLNFALTVVVARLASPEAGGVFFAITSVFVLATSVCRLGGGTGIVYFVSRYVSLERRDEIRPTVRAAAVPVLVSGSLVAVVGLIGAPWFGPAVFGVDSSEVVTALRIVSILVGLGVIGDLATSTAIGLGTLRPLIVLENLGKPLLQFGGVTLVLVLVGDDLAAMVTGYVGPVAVLAVIGVVWTRRIVRARVDHHHDDDRTVRSDDEPGATEPAMTPRRFWGFTSPRAAQSVVQVALQRLDIIFVTALRGPEDAILYAAATRFLIVGLLGAQALATVIQPRISALMARDRIDEVRDLYQTATAWLVLITWPAYLLTAAHAGDLLRVFGDEFTVASTVLVVLGAAMLFSMGCGMVEVVLAMAGQTIWTLASSVTALAVSITLDLVLIPRHGINGAAIAWAAAIVSNNSISLWRLHATTRIHPFGRATLTAMALAAWTVGLPALALQGLPLVAVVVGTVLSGVIYVAALYRFRSWLRLDAFLTPRTLPTH